jgi:hypothetical protein
LDSMGLLRLGSITRMFASLMTSVPDMGRKPKRRDQPRMMRFRWNAPDNDLDSESSSEGGEPARRCNRPRRPRKPGRHARFRDDAAPSQPAFTVPVIPGPSTPTFSPQRTQTPVSGRDGQRSEDIFQFISLPPLETIQPGRPPGPFDIVPRGESRFVSQQPT